MDHRRTVKLSDMGLARKLGKGQSSYTASVGGTVGWQAPELYSGGRISKAVDMFSLGCIFYFVLTKGKHPFGERYRMRVHSVFLLKNSSLFFFFPLALSQL